MARGERHGTAAPYCCVVCLLCDVVSELQDRTQERSRGQQRARCVWWAMEEGGGNEAAAGRGRAKKLGNDRAATQRAAVARQGNLCCCWWC